ncbi:hypothetical protein GCM10011380_19370 [Sphingomonas metalli]|jgi:hypothetical protein|uniref:BLUF domain-containing protein n=1 Tax=Sphingomonas metalli TaxID=1779358 RepID=A0A916T365_9SPHN|nr:BLUF domain-containing protein [Sphingomonas metalli]GGB30054.1 hypothetical protein GCM10011380_19370 [Sphingomonas metalli]
MMESSDVRRLIYASRAVGANAVHDHELILAQSRRNNGLDGISGILSIRDDQYLQLIEGPADSVGMAFERIARDPRHTDIRLLDDRMVEERQFGDWSMASLPGDHPEDAAARLRWLLRNADPEVASFFL